KPFRLCRHQSRQPVGAEKWAVADMAPLAVRQLAGVASAYAVAELVQESVTVDAIQPRNLCEPGRGTVSADPAGGDLTIEISDQFVGDLLGLAIVHEQDVEIIGLQRSQATVERGLRRGDREAVFGMSLRADDRAQHATQSGYVADHLLCERFQH